MLSRDSISTWSWLSVPVLFCGMCTLAVHGDEPSQPAPKDPADKSGSFIFVNDRPDDHLLALTGEVPKAISRGLRIRVTESGSRKWLLPVYLVTDVQLPTAARREVKIILVDALYDDQIDRAITEGMDKTFGKEAWKKAVPIDNRVSVTLRITAGERDVPLGTLGFRREVEKRQHVLTFSLASDALADRVVKTDPKDFGLTFDETYRGKFTDEDLVATATVSSTSATNFKNNLGTDSQGQKASLLVRIGGKVDQRVSIRQEFAQQVAIEVWTSEGKSVNQTLLDSFVAKLFAGVTEDTTLAKHKDETVVTFLTSNGLRATTSIGTYKGLKDQWKKDRDNLLKTANSGRTKDRTKVSGEAEASAFEVFSASVKFEQDSEHDREWANSFEQQVKSVDETMKAIEGELPVAVLSADQMQQLVSRADTATKVTTGTFREGRKPMQHRQSLERAFEVVAAKATPKSETELFREKAARLTDILGRAREAEMVALAARDAADREYLSASQAAAEAMKTYNAAVAAVAAAKTNLDQALAAADDKFNKTLRVNGTENEVRRSIENDLKVPRLRVEYEAAIGQRGSSQVLAGVRAKAAEEGHMRLEVSQREADKLTASAKTLEAELSALNRLIGK